LVKKAVNKKINKWNNKLLEGIFIIKSDSSVKSRKIKIHPNLRCFAALQHDTYRGQESD